MATLESRTMFGRKRNLNETGTGYYARLRTCVNSFVQGSQADMMKLCMIVLFNTLKDKYGLTDALVLQVHDEMVLDVPESISEQVLATVKEVAINFYKPYINFSVPLKIEIKVLTDWAGMKSTTPLKPKPKSVGLQRNYTV